MFNDIFKFEKCDCCNGTGKGYFYLFNYGRNETKIIKKNFPNFDSRKSCQNCFGSGETSNLTTGLANHELFAHMQNKIWNRRSRRE